MKWAIKVPFIGRITELGDYLQILNIRYSRQFIAGHMIRYKLKMAYLGYHNSYDKAMNYKPKSISTFLGSKNFEESRNFYSDLGFKESPIDSKLTFFIIKEDLGIYLQAYYAKEWVENTMVFLEVDNVDSCYEEIKGKDLGLKYKDFKMTGIKEETWGREFHVLDPAGNLWHFGNFKSESS